eukprot:TRINITY_DN2958_c2_g1_i1.p1 TRINITY_DN2958_c2_g1~~TRINITY_DN2958_c2_g1_i1.p1  ORF type:complete len:996 (+),score=174.59 TRINITY_DN2958_c2_g1_i1:36-2990(+)
MKRSARTLRCKFCRTPLEKDELSSHVRFSCPEAVGKPGEYCEYCDDKFTNFAKHMKSQGHADAFRSKQASTAGDRPAIDAKRAATGHRALREPSLDHLLGHRVVRGPDWQASYGTEDGGPGAVGVVVAVWSVVGPDGGWLGVNWMATARSGNYRWKVGGCSDLKLADVDSLAESLGTSERPPSAPATDDAAVAASDVVEVGTFASRFDSSPDGDNSDDDDDDDDDPLVRRRGRPSEWEKYVSAESRLVRAVVQRYPSVPDKFVDELLKILHAPGFQLDRLAPSLYLLQRVQGAEMPDVPTLEATLTTLDGAKVFYHRPLDIMKHLLTTANPSDLHWRYEFNDGTISAAWNSDLWRDAERHFDGYLRSGLKLLLLTMFEDAYRQHSKRRAKLTGLYVGAANDAKERMFLVCIAPDASELDDNGYRLYLDELLGIVMIPDLRLLEGGQAALTVGAVQQSFCGSLHLVIGDDIGQRQLAGLLGPRAAACSRFSYKLSKDFVVLQDPPAPPRDPQRDRAAFDALATARVLRNGQIGRCEDFLQELGLKAMTVLWLLRFFSINFYWHLGICLLHLHLEGNWKRIGLYIAQKYGRAVWLEINARMSAYPHYRTLFRFPSGLFYERVSKRTGDKKLSLDHLTGDQMDSATQMFEVCLVGLVSQADIAVVSNYFDYDSLCLQPSFTQKNLKEDIPRLRLAWKRSMIASFGDVEGCSFSYPNFDTEDHIETSIQKLGPMRIQNGAKGESCHRAAKKRGGNQRNLSRDVLAKTDRAVLAPVVDIPRARAHRVDKMAYSALGKATTISSAQVVAAVRERLAVVWPGAVLTRVREHAGFRIRSNYVYARTEVLVTSFDGSQRFGFVLGVFECTLQPPVDSGQADPTVRLLLHVQERQHLADETIGAHVFPVLSAASTAGLWPLGWANWEVVRQISVVKHAARDGLFLYNNRVRREVDCRIRPVAPPSGNDQAQPADDDEDVDDEDAVDMDVDDAEE